MNLTLLILPVLGLHLLAVMSPGPNFLVSLQLGLTNPRPVSLFAALGIATGTLVHVTLGFLGLSAILAHSLWLFAGLKILGAIYLIYLGVKSLLKWRNTPPDWPADITAASLNRRQAYRVGLVTCLTNPKSAIYYLALFTSVISITTPLAAKLTLVLLLPLVSLGWYSIVTLLVSLPWFRAGYRRVYRGVDAAIGALLLGLGFRLALLRP